MNGLFQRVIITHDQHDKLYWIMTDYLNTLKLIAECQADAWKYVQSIIKPDMIKKYADSEFPFMRLCSYINPYDVMRCTTVNASTGASHNDGYVGIRNASQYLEPIQMYLNKDQMTTLLAKTGCDANTFFIEYVARTAPWSMSGRPEPKMDIIAIVWTDMLKIAILARYNPITRKFVRIDRLDDEGIIVIPEENVAAWFYIKDFERILFNYHKDKEDGKQPTN